jgi:two-component system NtrC family sensor kinase
VKEPVSLPELLDQALAINLSSLERHEIDVVREVASVPPVLTDRHQVLQLLVDLITNAQQSMHAAAGGVKRLTVRLRTDKARPGFVLLQISDTGMGIKPEHLSRIFGPGFTTKKDGHGFGPHSAALAARQNGGALEVHSDGEGRGATFTLHLPVAAGRLKAAA